MDRDTLRSFLECPICNFIPRNMKIFTCQNGHEICEDCHGRLNVGDRGYAVCPHGNCTYYAQDNAEPVRARKSEEMVRNANIEFNCVNVRSGCTVLMGGEDLSKHEEDCVYRSVYCPFCKTKEIYEEFENHMNEYHQEIEKWDYTPGEWFSQNYEVNHAEMNEDNDSIWDSLELAVPSGEKFYATLCRKQGVWYSGLYILTPRGATEAEKWKVTIIAENIGSKVVAQFQCPVKPIDSSVTDIVESGYCLALQDRTVVKIIEGDSVKLVLRYKIEKYEDAID